MSKLFANEAFDYRKVTVERPLRLNFAATPEPISRLEDEKAFPMACPLVCAGVCVGGVVWVLFGVA
ncbi:MAG: hypothetical protein OXG37_12390, partial [Actinomycetia bacterium]|nr:hypothetical protein [Actinomycetes bacterium]